MNDFLKGTRERSLSEELFYLSESELESRGVNAISVQIGEDTTVHRFFGRAQLEQNSRIGILD